MGKTASFFGFGRQRKQAAQNAQRQSDPQETRSDSSDSSETIARISARIPRPIPEPIPEPIPLARKNDLILALDFGTTFSGIAYVYRHHGVVSRSTDIDDIHSWPGDGGGNHKTPTRIQYLPQSDSNFKWGYEVNPLGDHIFGLKLLFDPDQPKPYDVTDICADPLNLPKPIEGVAADFMRALYKHATDMICRSIAADENEMDKLYEKHYVITVPAVWSDKAKQLTFEAAKKAGVYPLDLITEPEAAALYTLDWMKGRGLKENSAVVICDAGGGTVDLVTYKIQQLEPLQLRQLTPSTGAVAGSISLDARFQEEVAKAVGSNQFLALKTTKAYRAAMREFDVNVKQAFRGLDDDDVYVTFPTAQLPDNIAMGLESNIMAFSAKRIADMFEPTINTIIDLVRSQIESALEASNGKDQVQFVFLVGGFGSNEYLRRTLEESNPNVKIVQPEAARKAVMMGAVLSKLTSKPVVLSTRARKSYGTRFQSRYDETADNGRPKFWDEWTERYKCYKMTWHIRKGEELDREKKVPVAFYQTFEGHDPKTTVSRIAINFYESTKPVLDYPDDNMRVNCMLVLDLHQIPDSHFQKRYRKSDGAKYSTLHYDLLIENNQSGLPRFSLKVDGRECGAVEACY